MAELPETDPVPQIAELPVGESVPQIAEFPLGESVPQIAELSDGESVPQIALKSPVAVESQKVGTPQGAVVPQMADEPSTSTVDPHTPVKPHNENALEERRRGMPPVPVFQTAPETLVTRAVPVSGL